MSKEKKEIHHIVQMVDKLAASLKKPKNVQKVAPKAPKRIADISQQQGEYAAASVFFPEQCMGARVPDRVAIPTGTSQTITTIDANSVTFTSGNAIFMRFLPNTAGCLRVAATASGDLVATETTHTMNGDATLSTLVDQLRIVSASIRATLTASALNVSGIWYAANHKSESATGTLVGLNPFNTAPKYRNRGTGKFTEDDPSMRFVWFPGDEEDQDFEPYPGQMASDNTVMDIVVIFGSSGYTMKVDNIINIEYAPTSAATQVVPAVAVVGDPSTYNQVLQQGMVNTNMNVITSNKFNDDVKKVSGAIKGITSVVGDLASGNWMGAVKDGIASAGSIFEGAKSGYNLISSAISSWFGLSPDADHALRCLLMLSSIDSRRRDSIRAEFETLVEKKLVPAELLDVFTHLEDLNLTARFEKGSNGRMHIVSVESVQLSTMNSPLVLVPKQEVSRKRP
jgi:hypothetical protein